ncbi:MAG: hypothetical protein RMK32_02080 [Anaerolineae bacterium]|nr:hypothetical protein [Anaerolineae bacterium]
MKVRQPVVLLVLGVAVGGGLLWAAQAPRIGAQEWRIQVVDEI